MALRTSITIVGILHKLSAHLMPLSCVIDGLPHGATQQNVDIEAHSIRLRPQINRSDLKFAEDPVGAVDICMGGACVLMFVSRLGVLLLRV